MSDILKAEEMNALADHEAVIDRGLKIFVEVGEALAAINHSRLYRNDYSSFSDYCEARWGFKKSMAYDLINGAKVVHQLEDAGCTTLPANEAQARELNKIKDPQLRTEIWSTLIDEKGAENITAKDIKEAFTPKEEPHPHLPFDSADMHGDMLTDLPQNTDQTPEEKELNRLREDAAGRFVTVKAFAEQFTFTESSDFLCTYDDPNIIIPEGFVLFQGDFMELQHPYRFCTDDELIIKQMKELLAHGGCTEYDPAEDMKKAQATTPEPQEEPAVEESTPIETGLINNEPEEQLMRTFPVEIDHMFIMRSLCRHTANSHNCTRDCDSCALDHDSDEAQRVYILAMINAYQNALEVLNGQD